jgi:nitroreductase
VDKSVKELIAQRYSCRTYVDRPIDEEHRRRLSAFLAENAVGPFGSRARLALVAAAEDDRATLKRLGTYGFIKGATGFMVGALPRPPGGTRQTGGAMRTPSRGGKQRTVPGAAAPIVPRDLEDYGYLMEHAVLFATDLGLGTCWLGGTFSKSRFADAARLRPDELMPAVVAMGYAVGDGSADPIRKRAAGDRRLPAAQLFFDRTFGVSLPDGRAGAYARVLDAVRRAPSASNKQPWRLVRAEGAWHFYLQRSKGYGKNSLLFSLLRLADLQRVDLGIAMCHFELTARELGLAGAWVIDEPGIAKPAEDTEYTATWRDAAV